MRVKTILVSLTLIIVLIAGSSCSLPLTESTTTSAMSEVSTSSLSASPVADIDSVSVLPDFVSVIAEVKPSVVAITTEASVRVFGRQFTQEGAGSGWIIDENGLIVTNSHVVEGAESVTVTLEDGRTFPAESVITESEADLALIQIDARDLPALEIGSSSDIQVGEWVVAIGNALGLGTSATKGIVSALGVSITISAGDTMDELIQTDAAINPGNSGGPLVNMLGQVVGINTVKVSDVGVEGMSYAISIDKAIPIFEELTDSD
jgi:S1-C subfamily serine protease